MQRPFSFALFYRPTHSHDTLRFYLHGIAASSGVGLSFRPDDGLVRGMGERGNCAGRAGGLLFAGRSPMRQPWLSFSCFKRILFVSSQILIIDEIGDMFQKVCPPELFKELFTVGIQWTYEIAY